MKIGILTQYYPPEIGAPQARLSKLAKHFVKRGHRCFVLTAMPNYPRGYIYPGYRGLFRREEFDGVIILRSFIYPTKRVNLIPRLTNYFSFTISSLFVGSMFLPQLDYLITESPPLFIGISGYILSRLKCARWIFNVSDLWPESAVRLGVVKGGWSLQVALALESFCYNNAWLVTGQSREIVKDIQSRFPHVRVYHLPNGVDTNLFTPDRRSSDIRHSMGDGKKCIAIYAGLHGVAQGLEQILEAAVQLKDLSDLLVVFVGDGPEKESLIRQSQMLGLTNVRFLEPYPHEVMPSLLASADIALVPLKKRLPGAVPSKLYEAMASGLPVVLIADGEPADIIRETQSGVVVSPGDIGTLVSVLRDLVEHPDKRKLLGFAGRQAAITRFDHQSIINNFIDFLEMYL